MVAMPQGEMAPGWKSAPLKKLLAVNEGPFGITVSENVALKVPELAVTVTAPVVAPASTWTEALPFASVVAVPAESTAGPVRAKFTGMPEAGPLAEFNCTTSGDWNDALIRAVWLLPEIICKPVISTFAVIVNVADMLGLLAKATLTDICPDAELVSAALVCTRPFESEVVVVAERVAALDGLAVQTTCWPARGLPPASKTAATREPGTC